MLTISNRSGITEELEDRLEGMYKDSEDMPMKFENKEIIFLTSRVHPGESPASHMLEGLVDFLLEDNA